MARLITILTAITVMCLSAAGSNADPVHSNANSTTSERGVIASGELKFNRNAAVVGPPAALAWNNSAWLSPSHGQSLQQPTPTSLASAIQKERALGLYRYQLDHRTAVLGWRVAPRWFLGQQRGDDSGLTLVWQKDGSDQLSLSKDGVRISRRF